MLPAVDDVAESLDRAPDVAERGVQGNWRQADNVRRSKIRSDAAGLQCLRDANCVLTFERDVSAAPGRLARGADREVVGR